MVVRKSFQCGAVQKTFFCVYFIEMSLRGKVFLVKWNYCAVQGAVHTWCQLPTSTMKATKRKSTSDVILDSRLNAKQFIFKAKLCLCVLLQKLINPCPFYHPPKAECKIRASVGLTVRKFWNYNFVFAPTNIHKLCQTHQVKIFIR